MREVFDATFSIVNILPAFAMVFVLGYWLLVIFGALDVSSFDFDIDVDADLEVDASFEQEVDATGEADISWLNEILRFFNIGKIPLMVFLTFWALPTWFICVLVNYTLGFQSFLMGLVILIPTAIVGLFISKILTYPFVKIFAALDKDSDSNIDLIGQICTVILPVESERMGQAEIFVQGSSSLLNAKTKEGRIEKGKKAMITNYIAKEDYYIIEPHYSID